MHLKRQEFDNDLDCKKMIKIKRILTGSILSALLLGFLSAPATAVVGGADATGNPVVVSLIIDTGEARVGACSGALWKPRIIVTAAHCVVKAGTTEVVLPSQVLVFRPGVNRANVRPSAIGTHIVSPSGYRNSQDGFVNPNDIAFIVLDVELATPAVSRLASEAEVAALIASRAPLPFFGYGLTSYQGEVSTIPFTLNQNPLSYAGADKYLFGTTAKNVGACQGDSGGPVVGTFQNELLLIGPIAGGSGAPCFPSVPDRFVIASVASAYSELANQALALGGYPADIAIAKARPKLKRGQTFQARTLVTTRLNAAVNSSSQIRIVRARSNKAGVCSATSTSLRTSKKGNCTVTFSVKSKGQKLRTFTTTFRVA
jgi:secreted trypsin-like serine protease